jgi:hypothetical protein
MEESENRRHQQLQQQQSILQRKRDAETQMDADHAGFHSDSSDQITVIERQYHHQDSRSQMDPGGLMMSRSRSFYQTDHPMMDHSIIPEDPTLGGRIIPVRNRKKAKSKSPAKRQGRNQYQTQITPAISPNIDVFGILENVAKTEGAFSAPEDALRASIAAFTQDAW